jgi:sirohydrochlorin ferrochelatase
MPSPGSRAEDVLVAVAHGSADPRAGAAIAELTDLVRDRAPGLDVRTAFLDHAAPSLGAVLASIPPGRRVTVLPLLLTEAYHSKTDIPHLLARSHRTVTYGSTLGPHPLLLRGLAHRLGLARHLYSRTALVLASAGSSDPVANAVIAELAADWQRAAGWQAVLPAYASAASPTPAEAVARLRADGARRVVVATYLLAPGFFADRIRSESMQAGADLVSPALGALPQVADVLLLRYAQARAARLRAA